MVELNIDYNPFVFVYLSMYCNTVGILFSLQNTLFWFWQQKKKQTYVSRVIYIFPLRSMSKYSHCYQNIYNHHTTFRRWEMQNLLFIFIFFLVIAYSERERDGFVRGKKNQTILFYNGNTVRSITSCRIYPFVHLLVRIMFNNG